MVHIICFLFPRWGPPGIGYLERQENRPRLLNIEQSNYILVEKIILKNSPYWYGGMVTLCSISAHLFIFVLCIF